MARKLFFYDDPPYTNTITSLPSPPLEHRRPTAKNATSPPPSSSKKLPQQQQQQLPQHNPSFDSSMALTVVVLLTALFFMGFFSIYIRRFSGDDPTTAHLSRRRRYRSGPLDTNFSLSSDSDPLHASSASRKGLDPTTIRSLPVYSYLHGTAAKYHQVDCAICLTEFEEMDCVKLIPNCKHVFHVECIDTWLCSHLSCPVCRGTRFFETKGSCGELGVKQESISLGVSESSTVSIGDTCIMLGSATASRVRRSSSCSSLGQRAMLQRTLSF